MPYFASKIFLSLALGLAAQASSDWVIPDKHLAEDAICEDWYVGLIPGRVPGHLVEQPSITEKFVISAERPYRRDALYIGVANDGKSNHHYYLIADDQRFDGRPFLKKPTKKSTRWASKGVVFQIPAPPEVVEKVAQRIRDENFTRDLSCLHSLCRILEAEGVVIGEKGQKVRTKVISAQLADGKVTIQGKPVNAEEMRLWASAEDEVEHYFQRAENADAAVAAQVSAKITTAFVVVTATGLAGTGLVIVVYPAVEEWRAQQKSPEMPPLRGTLP